MKTAPLTAEIHREWGWRPFVKPHNLPQPGCSYTLNEWPNKTQPFHSWWTVSAFVDDFGNLWAVTSH